MQATRTPRGGQTDEDAFRERLADLSQEAARLGISGAAMQLETLLSKLTKSEHVQGQALIWESAGSRSGHGWNKS